MTTFFNKDYSDIKPAFVVESTEQVYPLVKNGFGIGVYYLDSLKKLNDPDIVEIKFANISLPELKAVCVYNKESLSKVAYTFIKGLLDYFAIKAVH